jgi:hypothetical protein
MSTTSEIRSSATEALNWSTVSFFTLAVVVTLLLCEIMPRPAGTVAILSTGPANGALAMEIVARSGGTFEEISSVAHIVLARSDDPDFVSRLYANGALLVFNPGMLAGCRKN